MGGRGLLRTRVIGILALLLIAVASWIFIISPRLEEPGLLEATANSATDQSAALKSQVSLLEQQEHALPQAEQAADSIATRFTPSPDVPFLIEQIEGAAGRAGMSPDQVLGIIPTAPTLVVAAGAPAAPAAPASADPNASAAPATTDGGGARGSVQTARMDVKISVKGTYQQVMEFLVQLQTSDRVVIIDNVSITSVAVDTAGTTVTNPDGTTTTVPPVSTAPMYQVEISAHVILIQALPSVQNDIPQDPNATANPNPSAGASPAATIAPSGDASSASPSASHTKKTKKPKASASPVASPAPSVQGTPVPVVTEQPAPVDSSQPVPVPSDQPLPADTGQPNPGATIVPTP